MSQENYSNLDKSGENDHKGNSDVSRVLNESANDKVEYLRKATEANRFLSSVRKNTASDIPTFLSNHDFPSEQEKVRVTSEAIKFALENDNEDLALNIKNQGFGVSPTLFLDAITDKNDKVVSGVVRLQIYNEEFIQAYFWYLLHDG